MLGAVPEHWQIKPLPGLVTSVGDKFPISLNQLAEIQLLVTAVGVGVGVGGCSSEGDAPTIQRLKSCWMKGRACVAPRSDQS